MVKGSVTARAVSLQDIMSDLKVIDKKKISLGDLELDISEHSKRTIEDTIQKNVDEIVAENQRKGMNIDNNNVNYLQNPDKEDKENGKEEKEEGSNSSAKELKDDHSNDMII